MAIVVNLEFPEPFLLFHGEKADEANGKTANGPNDPARCKVLDQKTGL